MTKSQWPSKVKKDENLPEMKIISQTLHIKTISEFPFERFSSLQRMKRVVGYIFRFIKNCQNKNERLTDALPIHEIAQNILIQIAQNQSFSEDIKSLKLKEDLNQKSKLLSLKPFLDKNLILRVGGRLTDSELEHNKKHPILVDAKHELTKLLFEYEHKR